MDTHTASNSLPLLREGPSGISGMGLFASHGFSSKQRLLEYRGVKVHRDALEDRSEINRETLAILDDDCVLDGGGADNLARRINHSCAPNSEMRLEEGHLWVYALRRIEPGEEITLHYGFSAREAVNWRCHCGSPCCCGFPVGEPWKGELLREKARRRRARALSSRSAGSRTT